MLAFAAAHGVAPIIQEFPMTAAGVERAFAELEAGRVRYRAVLVAEGE
jgi:D-arabinose 1-dehydrogenase-like Zn-dependent alcohol dehydrogenase